MGNHKRKREALRRKETLDNQSGEDFALALFVEVWSYLEKLYGTKHVFVLSYILRHEKTLKVTVAKIFRIKPDRFCKSLLCNGKDRCRKLLPTKFSEETWSQIDDVFENFKPLKGLSTLLKRCIKALRSSDVRELRNTREKICGKATNISTGEKDFLKVSEGVLKECFGNFLGEWTAEILATLKEEIRPICRCCPKELIVMEKAKQCNLFYDQSGDECFLIAVVITWVVLEKATLKAIRRLLELLFAAHPTLNRGRKRMCAKSYMKGYGPFDNNFSGEINEVAFLTHDNKLRNVLGKSKTVEDFENLVDKYSHVDLMNVMLGLYLQFCPQVLEHLFDYHVPYLGEHEYTQSDLEKLIEGIGPSAYQLYVTKDYYVKMHTDSDATNFTLAYASHPDFELSPIEFTIPEYGARLPIHDGDLFAFRSNVCHGTGYRIPTKNPAYVGAITVNSKLDNLYDRCRNGS